MGARRLMGGAFGSGLAATVGVVGGGDDEEAGLVSGSGTVVIMDLW